MAGERTVTGTLLRPNGAPWANGQIRFKLVEDAYTTSPAAHYPSTTTIAMTDASGEFEVILISGLSSEYEVKLPDGNTFNIIVEDGAATTLEALRLAYEGASIPLASAESIIAAMLESYTGLGITVQDGDSTIVATLGVLDFLGAEFAVTESPTGEANVALVRGTTNATDVPAGNHTHDTRYYTESEVDALLAAIAVTGAVQVKHLMTTSESATANTALADTTSKYTIPSADMVAGAQYRVRTRGSVNNTTGTARTVTLHARVGGATVDSFAAINVQSGQIEGFYAELEIRIVTTGSSGTAEIQGHAVIGTDASVINRTSTFTINTTINRDVNFAHTHEVTNAGITIRFAEFTVERLKT